MTKPNKPKEWWIDPKLKLIANSGETRDWQGIHVIEYSAYEELQAKLDKAIKALNKISGKIGICVNELRFNGGNSFAASGKYIAEQALKQLEAEDE